MSSHLVGGANRRRPLVAGAGRDGLEHLLRVAADNVGTIGFAGGLPAADYFPRRALTASFLRAIHRPGTPALQYSWPEGFAPLRGWIAGRLARRGAHVHADDVIVTSGAQQAITIAAQVLLRKGEAIGVDSVSYPSALATFRASGLVPVPTADARVLYRMPAVANPNGTGLALSERNALLASGKLIIEDDAYGDLRFTGPAMSPLLVGSRTHVIHVGTFSKTLGPGLRVGYLIMPARFGRRTLLRKQSSDLQANSLSQAVVQDYVMHNDFDRFVAGLRRHYARRAHRMTAALSRFLPSWRYQIPQGGFGLWITADGLVDEDALMRRCVKEGVTFDPGSWFRCQGAADVTQLRLCFSSVAEDKIEEGVRRLARAWHALARRRTRPSRKPRRSL